MVERFALLILTPFKSIQRMITTHVKFYDTRLLRAGQFSVPVLSDTASNAFLGEGIIQCVSNHKEDLHHALGFPCPKNFKHNRHLQDL